MMVYVRWNDKLTHLNNVAERREKEQKKSGLLSKVMRQSYSIVNPSCSKINFKFQTIFSPDSPYYSPLYKTMVNKCNSCVNRCCITAGEVNQFVESQFIEEAVSSGKIQGAFLPLSFLSGINDTLFELYTSQPFGINSTAFLSYMFNAGGLERLNKEYGEPKNLYFIPMCIVPPEVGGWFQKEMKTTQDFQDLKMRILGLGRYIIQGLGGETVLLPQKEIVNAVKTGIINSVEFSTIEIDDFTGLPEVLNYWYTPAWNQLSSIFYLVVNRQSWFAIDNRRRCQMISIIQENMYLFYLEDELKNSVIFEKLISQKREFSTEILGAMRKVWREYLDKEENIEIRDEYDKMKTYEVIFNEYELAMSKNLIE